MMRALEVVASSWPIAVMVIGLAVAFVVWRLVKRGIDYSEQSAREYRERERSNRAVAIRRDDD